MIDGVTNPGGILDGGQLGPRGRNKGPVWLVLCSLLDPSPDEGDLVCGQGLASRRHPAAWIGMDESGVQLAFFHVTGHQGVMTPQVGKCPLGSVQAEVSFAA